MQQSDRRICSFCQKEFYLTRDQKRQAKSKWPINCSRSCARKSQHARNHKEKRIKITCENCGDEFQAIKWEVDRGRKFCSQKCSNISRFGDPVRRRELMNEKIFKIIRDEKYYKYLKNIAERLSYNYRVDFDDLFQNYFLEILEGRNTTIEKATMSFVRKEYNRGITGKHYAGGITIGIDKESMNTFINKSKNMSDIELIEYLIDLKSVLSEYEFKIFTMILEGHNFELIRDKIKGSSAKFSETFKRLKYGS